MVISSRNREILKKTDFFFVPHKSLVIFAKKTRNSEKVRCSFLAEIIGDFCNKSMKSLQKSKKYSWRNHWGFLPGNSEIRKSMIQEKLPGEINGVSSQVSSQHFPYDFDTRTNQWRFFNQIQPI